MTLRDYQNATVDAFFAYWLASRGNPVAALPTGTGKSLIIAGFAIRALSMYPQTRIIVATHVKELVEQNFAKLVEMAPTISAGIYSAGLRRKDIEKSVTFAGIGSIAKKAHLFGKIDLLFIDECHTVSPKETTLYRKFINDLLTINPLMKVAGLTATPYRLGQGMIVEPGGIFSDICLDLTTKDAFNWFLSEGYLKPLIPKRTRTEYDISSVPIASTGDFNLSELQAAVDKEALTRAAVAEMLQLASDRNHWLVFAAGIQHAEHVAAILTENGISAVAVHSKSSNEERDSAVGAFKGGKVRALVNNGVFTTGFDFPGIDMIAVLRHTTSPGLWVQMLGRGTRPVWLPGFDLATSQGRLACIAAGTPNCLVLDFAANTRRLGPINDPIKPRTRKKSDKPGDCPVKACEICMGYNHASARICSQCGAEFIFQVKFKTEAATDELIAGALNAEAEPVWEWFEVETVTYSKHVPWNAKKRDGSGRAVPSLRVTYNCKGIRSFTEYVCLEHGGHAQASARQWWIETSSGLTVPATVSEALASAEKLRQPARLRVWVNRKNPQILFREFP